jgi:hypothetical protein
MIRFSVRTLLAFVLLAAIVCAILFALPEGWKILSLFIGVLALPGPLVVLSRRGTPAGKAFALGGLASYLVWFAMVGLPCGIHAVYQYGEVYIAPIASISTNPNSPDAVISVSAYYLFGGLYMPWIIVLVAGIGSVIIHSCLCIKSE